LNPLSEKKPESELYINENYKILYEDDWLMAVDKPSPLPVHRVGRFYDRNLLSLLKKNGAAESCAVVNRLDSETSGIVLVAKNSEAAGKLGQQFAKRSVDKEYQAIVFGNFEASKARGTIQIPLGFKEINRFRLREENVFGESAQTDYEVLEQKEGYSLVRIFPQTGRTHQIRAHMAFTGHPLVGDKLYLDPAIFESYITGGWQEWMKKVVKLPRLALHACLLKIKHPLFEDELEFISEFPELLKSFWESLA
jgi:23S rRNA pseudouridine1911/1915/1917 synthase